MNNIQNEFISTVSHELRTPLTSIRGFSQTLLNSWEKIDDENKKKFIKIIEEQSNRLINLVENILSVSKLNSEAQVLKKIDLNNSIKKIVQLFPNSKFIMDLSSNLPCARLDEDNLALLEKLGDLLKINVPLHIELFDNSHLQGEEAIGAMVCFINGVKNPSMYRKYNINNSSGIIIYKISEIISISIIDAKTIAINVVIDKPNT